MKTNYLLPNNLKSFGWILLIPSTLLGLLITIYDMNYGFFDFRVPALFIDEILGKKQLFGIIENNLLNEIVGIIIIISSMMVAFSKEKVEDEFIAKLRMDSLAWAVYFNQAVLLFSMCFIYDMAFLWVMIFNMFTLLWFFIIRFNWLKNKLNKL
jgi:hypothetical protein